MEAIAQSPTTQPAEKTNTMVYDSFTYNVPTKTWTHQILSKVEFERRTKKSAK